MSDPHANEWLGLLWDWELVDSSCSLQNEGSSTLTNEGGAGSDYECTNNMGLRLCDSSAGKYASDSATIFNHTPNTHTITTSSNSLHLHGILSKSKEEHTLFSSPNYSFASPLDATSTTTKSHSPPPVVNIASYPPPYHTDTKSQAVKETTYPSFFNSHNGSYNNTRKSSSVKEGKVWPYESGNFPLVTADGQQECVRSNASNGMARRHLVSVKSNSCSNTYVQVSLLDQASEICKASDNVHLMHQEGKEPPLGPSFNYTSTKCSDIDANHAKTTSLWSSQPRYGKKMTPSASLPWAQPAIATHQSSKSLTFSFNQQNNPTSKSPHNYHDDDGEYLTNNNNKNNNNSSLELLFSNPKYSSIMESELDDMSGITRDDDEESFALITHAYRTRKKAKVEDDSSIRHCLAERKRREKLNKKFDELRTIVGPSLSAKTDKASIIGAAIKLLIDKRSMQTPEKFEVSTTDIMKEVLNKTQDVSNFHSNLMPKGDKAIPLNGSTSFQVDLHPHKTNQHNLSEVFCDLQADFELGTTGSSSCDSLLHDVKVSAKQDSSKDSSQRRHYLINVTTPKRSNIFSDIISTLSNLDLQVIFANSCFFTNNNTLSITSPTFTWFLLKVEVVEKLSSFDFDKCEIIHNAIKRCIMETRQKKSLDLMVEGLGV